jgi:peptidoglycan/xylan/chitin deacetylase (PgdA/CDA1 family)
MHACAGGDSSVSVVRQVVGNQVKRAFYTTGLHALLKRIRESSHPIILRYHSICDENPLISKDITVSPHAFEEQVRYFSRHFNTISMSTLIDCIRNKWPLPKNALVLTFDDGYADNYEAARILHKYGLVGLFYITVGCIETEEKFWVAEVRYLLGKTRSQKVSITVRHKTFDASLACPEERTAAIGRITHLLKTVDIETREEARSQLRKQCPDVDPFSGDLMLTWRLLKDMVTMGMEIGGHTMTHGNLPSAKTDEAWFEIATCKSLLEQQLGIQVTHFAYPNGGSERHYDDRIKAFVQQAGFHSATTSKSGLVGFGDDLFELRRMRATERLFEMLWEIEEVQGCAMSLSEHVSAQR